MDALYFSISPCWGDKEAASSFIQTKLFEWMVETKFQGEKREWENSLGVCRYHCPTVSSMLCSQETSPAAECCEVARLPQDSLGLRGNRVTPLLKIYPKYILYSTCSALAVLDGHMKNLTPCEDEPSRNALNPSLLAVFLPFLAVKQPLQHLLQTEPWSDCTVSITSGARASDISMDCAPYVVYLLRSLSERIK